MLWQIRSLFTENYEKRAALIGVLKSYATSGNIEKLAKALVVILEDASQRKIIPYIRYAFCIVSSLASYGVDLCKLVTLKTSVSCS